MDFLLGTAPELLFNQVWEILSKAFFKGFVHIFAEELKNYLLSDRINRLNAPVPVVVELIEYYAK
jgi:hypothetical protein